MSLRKEIMTLRITTTFGEFIKRKIQERKKAKARNLAYTDAVKKVKLLQVERKCVVDELTSISDFMKTTETMLGLNK